MSTIDPGQIALAGTSAGIIMSLGYFIVRAVKSTSTNYIDLIKELRIELNKSNKRNDAERKEKHVLRTRCVAAEYALHLAQMDFHRFLESRGIDSNDFTPVDPYKIKMIAELKAIETEERKQDEHK